MTPTGLQAGAAVIDNETREIVSLYAGKNYKKADFHRAYQAVRQPGSAIKPLLVYAPLFESGSYTENSIVNSGNYLHRYVLSDKYRRLRLRQRYS